MRSLAFTVLMLLVERGLQIAAAVAIASMVARSAGPEGFGLFQYVQSLVFVASAAALVCGAEVVVPRLSRPQQTPGQQHSIIVHAFVLRIGGAVLGYAGLVVAAAALGPGPGDRSLVVLLACILGITVLVREPFGVVTAWAQAHSRLQPLIRQSLAVLAVKAGAVAAAYAYGVLTLPVVAALFAAESLVLAVLAWRHYRGATGRQGKVRLDRTLFRAMALQGLVYFVGLAGLLLFKRVDQLMLKNAVTLAELGNYAAAIQLTDNVTLAATIIAATLGPRLIYAEADARRARSNLWRLCAGLAAFGLLSAGVLWAAAATLVRWIYGEGFEQAVQLLRLAALTVPLVFLDAGLNVALLRDGKAAWVAAKWLGAALVAVIVNQWAIAAWGTPGPIAGIACGLACALLVNLAWVLKQRGTH